MIDVKNFCTAMKAAWASKLYKCKDESWAIIPRKYLENCEIEKVLCMNFENEKHNPIKLPTFYSEVIESWHLCGGGRKAPQNANDIRREQIWDNKFIQTRGKMLFYTN